MKKAPKKLTLNQETLRNLSDTQATANMIHTKGTCVVSNCPFPCTPVVGVN